MPPTRPAKGITPTYSTAIPPASEAYWPENFNRIWRYLYSWLEKKDADDAAKAASSSTKYPYPAGYSNVQKSGPTAGGAQVRILIHGTHLQQTLIFLCTYREVTLHSLTSRTMYRSLSQTLEQEPAKQLRNYMSSFHKVLRLIHQSFSCGISKRQAHCNPVRAKGSV